MDFHLHFSEIALYYEKEDMKNIYMIYEAYK